MRAVRRWLTWLFGGPKLVDDAYSRGFDDGVAEARRQEIGQ